MSDTVNDILGTQADKEDVDQIKKLITEEENVYGAYDLIMFNYGPNKNYASVHVELPDTMTIEEADNLSRHLQVKVYKETGVILTGIGVYSFNTSDSELAAMRNKIQETVLAHDWALQLHGFYVDTENKTIRFDVVVSFDIENAEAVSILTKEVHELYPDYTLSIIPDIDA